MTKTRVLYVTHRVPYPPDRGDRIRTWNLLKFLGARADVDLACLTDEPVSATVRHALNRTAHRTAVIPHAGLRRYAGGFLSMMGGRTVTEGLFSSGLLRRTIRAWNTDTHYDAAIASSSGVASYILPPILRTNGHVWVDLIDVDSQKWLDYAKVSRWPMSMVYGCEGRLLRSLESRLSGQVDRLLVVTEAERDLFGTFSDPASVDVVGNGVDTDYFAPADLPPTPFSCVFVGVMDYRPNIDAVCWFVQNVWPELQSRFPQATFNIVGKSPAQDVLALGSVSGVSVTGAVPDVRPWLHKAACVVVPLRIARGVQNKVLEAMACGRPIVCSTAPLQGLDVEPGLQLLSADSADQWVESVACVFEDRQRARELGIAASAWVQMNHRWDCCLEPVCEFVERRGRASVSEPEFQS